MICLLIMRYIYYVNIELGEIQLFSVVNLADLLPAFRFWGAVAHQGMFTLKEVIFYFGLKLRWLSVWSCYCVLVCSLHVVSHLNICSSLLFWFCVLQPTLLLPQPHLFIRSGCKFLFAPDAYPVNMSDLICIRSRSARKCCLEAGPVTFAHRLASDLLPDGIYLAQTWHSQPEPNWIPAGFA